MVCPRCDGQGIVLRVRLKSTGQMLFMCDECNALWKAVEEIRHPGWEDFNTYMRARGLDPRTEVELLGELDSGRGRTDPA